MDTPIITPSLEKLTKIFNNVSNERTRVIEIDFSHAFHKYVNLEVEKLKLTSKVITLEVLMESSYKPGKKKPIIYRWVNRVVAFLMDTIPIISLLNLLSDMALDTAQHYLKEYEFKNLQKFLHPRKKASNYKKTKNIIVIPNLSDLNLEEVKFVEFIADLIHNKYVSSTVLLVLSDISYGIDPQISVAKKYNITLTANEVHNLLDTEKNSAIADILNSIGLEYLEYFSKIQLNDKKNNLIEKLINTMLESINYVDHTKDIEHFLKVCSYLFDEFKLLDLENINKQVIINYDKMLPKSLDAKLLIQPNNYKYSFSDCFFKEYFQTIMPVNLNKEECLKIMNYLEEEYPYQYANLAVTSKLMPLDDVEILSYHIIAFYHCKKQSLLFHKLICDHLQNDPLGKTIMKLNTYRDTIHAYSKEELSFACFSALELTKTYNKLSAEAKLCILNYISDVLYEIDCDQEHTVSIFNYYKELFQEVNLFSNPNERYLDYVLDAVIFATVIENYSVQKTVNKLIKWLDSCKITDAERKIKYYRLGNLLHALDPNKATNFTQMAYELSEGNIIMHEEARINYGVSLLGLGRYEDAYNLYKACRLKTLNCQMALDNNSIIVSYLLRKYSAAKTLNQFSEIFNNLDDEIKSDTCIIKNNYVSSLLINDYKKYSQKIEVISELILQSNEDYHAFYANHNLMILYYLKKDYDKFNTVLKRIKVPFLMRRKKKGWMDKFSFLKNKFYTYTSLTQLEDALSHLYNKDVYGNNLDMRAVLFGLMERWFK